jgi:hypothetical protein
MQSNDRFRFRPRLEGFEDRAVPALLTGAVSAALVAPSVQSTSLGDRMSTFLQGKIGSKVGGGECAHIATAALQAVGADFTRTEPNGTSDYVWTSNRVARLTSGSQVAGKQFRVGDIIQFENATFSAGGSSKLKHHTQVVAAVDGAGRITQVYEQNITINGVANRTVMKRTAIDLTKLTGGSVSIYRAVARVPQAGQVEYTIVNNTNASRTVTLQIGSSTSSYSLDTINTKGSYRTGFATFSGSAKPVLKVGNTSLTIQDGAAYELYTQSNGQVGIRKL